MNREAGPEKVPATTPGAAGDDAGVARGDVDEHVRTSCALRAANQEPTTGWVEPNYAADDLELAAQRWALIELMLEAIQRATPLDAEERTPKDLLLVLAFRVSCHLVFKVDQTTGERHLRHLCRILHIEKLPDGTMLGNDAVRPVLAGPHRDAGGSPVL